MDWSASAKDVKLFSKLFSKVWKQIFEKKLKNKGKFEDDVKAGKLPCSFESKKQLVSFIHVVRVAHECMNEILASVSSCPGLSV